jgi:hypothetical protein
MKLKSCFACVFMAGAALAQSTVSLYIPQDIWQKPYYGSIIDKSGPSTVYAIACDVNNEACTNAIPTTITYAPNKVQYTATVPTQTTQYGSCTFKGNGKCVDTYSSGDFASTRTNIVMMIGPFTALPVVITDTLPTATGAPPAVAPATPALDAEAEELIKQLHELVGEIANDLP